MSTKGTTPTQIRIPDDVKPAVVAMAKAEGLDLSKVVVAFLRAWKDGHITLPPPNPQ